MSSDGISLYTPAPAPTPVPAGHEQGENEGGVSLWQDGLRRLSKNRLALGGFFFLVLLTLICLLTPWMAPYPFEQQNLQNTLQAPTFAHWMGTDTLGRDLLTRVLYGGRISMMVGLLAALVSAIVGVIYGAISGFIGGRTDNLMMRLVDILYALPFIFLVIILMVYFGRNIFLLFVALGFTQWLTMARIVRGQVISIKTKEFVQAAESMGVPEHSIIFRHLIPNSLGPVIVYLTLTVPSVILDEAFLSFLGLGVQAPMASWGTLISNGVETMEVAPWLLIFPALLLSLSLFSLNFLGDGLRDALDPKGAKD